MSEFFLISPSGKSPASNKGTAKRQGDSRGCSLDLRTIEHPSLSNVSTHVSEKEPAKGNKKGKPKINLC